MLSRVSGYVSDRLSSLPDDVIHKILSSMNIRDVIKTSVLSSRWRYIWTSMPHLDFSLTPAEIVANVLSNVMSHRDNLAQLSSLIISPCKPDFVFVERILKYAFGKNVQKLILISSFPSYDLTIPVSLFKSKSLKSLSLGVCIIRFNLPESTWELSALTALHLYDVTFHNDNTDHISSIDLFSKCVNLKKLSLICCTMRGAKGFRISNTCLSDLTIDDYQGELFRHLELCVNSLPSLKKLFLSVNHLLIEVDGSKMFGLLQQLHGVKFLTLNFELAKFLVSSMEAQLSRPPSPFTNLKSLNIYPPRRGAYPRAVCTKIEHYFLDSSPSAYFTYITGEEHLRQWQRMSEEIFS